MKTYAEYLTSLTVVELREIARQAGYVGSRSVSRTRKAELVNLVTILSSNDEDAAYEQDAVITEAYEVTAENAGITIPQYLACQNKHIKRGEIRISGFWVQPREWLTKVVTFDEGLKQAVSKGDARSFRGQIEDMPAGGKDVVCECCKETYYILDSAEKDVVTIDGFLSEIMNAIAPIAERAQRYQNNAIENDSPEADQWVQVAKDTMRLMGDIEWMRHYRS